MSRTEPTKTDSTPEKRPPVNFSDARGPSASETEVGSVFVSNYPPFSAWQADALPEYEDVIEQAPERASELGLYLHIPFCRKRCKFCYFRVYIDRNADQIQHYLDSLAREVEIYSRKPAVADRPLKFVYFGGGTPSYVAVKHMKQLWNRVRAAIPWDDVEEVTFECEPGTLTESKVHTYREMGVTRLSLGIENFDDAILRENGRAHETKEIHRCLPWIREASFDQLNVDLIAGMVGETWETWKDTLEKTIDVDPDSVTIYQMELPFNTVYSQGILKDGEPVKVADWETKRAWNEYAIDRLCEVGYEVSSAYTLVKSSGKAAGEGRFVYRDALWHGADMLGTGIASFGHMQGVHIQNVASWNDYLDSLAEGRLPWGRAYKTSAEDLLTRELILQMKLGNLDLQPFREKYGVDPLDRFFGAFETLEGEGMLRIRDRRHVELSRPGLLRVDSLLSNFYAERYQNARYT
ncbi:MAG: coproporphyrinogen III oxidase family protein [Thermoanaerobaculia bacterium]|nr:coproporphyrinogen III oxidase family protein [Thermoanaerobaculia bacterium]